MSRPVLVALNHTSKVAHYYYGTWPDQQEVAVFASNRVIFIRDGKNTNNLLHDPCYNSLHPYPGSGDCPDRDPNGVDFSYEQIGLYYGFAMPGTGWDGDC